MAKTNRPESVVTSGLFAIGFFSQSTVSYNITEY